MKFGGLFRMHSGQGSSLFWVILYFDLGCEFISQREVEGVILNSLNQIWVQDDHSLLDQNI